jgi:hypothetical protein
MDNPLFDCGSDEIKDAVSNLILKAAILRQAQGDGWKPVHMQKARDAVCEAAQDVLEEYEELYNPGNRINVLQEDEVLEAQANLLNNMSNNNSNNNNSNSNNNNSNSNNNNSNSNNNNSNSNNAANKKNGNQNGGKTRRRRKTQRRRKN